jgi:hypothetical protein
MKVSLRLLGLLCALALLARPSLAWAQDDQPEDRTVLGGNYTLAAGESLGTLTVIGGNVVLEPSSTIVEDIYLYGGQLTILGAVGEDIYTYGGSLTLGGTAHVNGDIEVTGGSLDQQAGAQVEGQVSHSSLTPFNFHLPNVWLPLWTGNGSAADEILAQIGWLGLQTIALTGLAVLAALLAPKVTERVGATAAGRPWEAGGLGLIIAILTPFLLIGFAITVVGIPITFILVTLAVVVLTFGWIALGLEVGKRLAQAFRTDWPPVVDAALGTLLLTLVANAIGLMPCVGWLVPTIVGFVGMGGVILSRFGTQVYPGPATPAFVQR